ncbi:hypothetical protein ZIOFF_008956 [Zingiber officinale]|uniref:Uncharacterized protein n=1 Tax=Zingiber officinale TaxID=94328 RepID=A0A8J5HTE6_ZINOF|nr:hypothetical protein ZIOFF_008956 [Zingiber officinale]
MESLGSTAAPIPTIRTVAAGSAGVGWNIPLPDGPQPLWVVWRTGGCCDAPCSPLPPPPQFSAAMMLMHRHPDPDRKITAFDFRDPSSSETQGA